MGSGNGGPPVGGPLLDHHHRMLVVDSAISEEAIARRGYFTATTAMQLRRLGFAAVQATTPALVIPIHGLDGELVGYQGRPDQPRVVDGKPLKYESPAGTTTLLDVPPGARDRARRSSAPLWITEGARKADSAVSRGLVCVSLPGVWGWVSWVGNEKTVLPDLQRVQLDQRKVVLAFDSDAMTKPAVHAALERLAAWLGSQGAWVHALYLAGDDGEKVGLDDFFAAGHPVDRLWEYVGEGVRPIVEQPKETVLPT